MLMEPARTLILPFCTCCTLLLLLLLHATAAARCSAAACPAVLANNTISRHDTAYTTNTRFVAFLGTFDRPAQEVWLPGNDIQDPTTWSVPSLHTLKHLHETLLQDFNCTEQLVANQPAQPSDAGGSAAANSGASPPLPPARAQDDSEKKILFSNGNLTIALAGW